MTEPLTADEIDTLARKRAGAKMGWYIHATVYVLVNLFLFAASHHAFGSRNWSVAPLLGWGLGLALHGLSVWFLGAGGALRERMIQRERDQIKQQQERR